MKNNRPIRDNTPLNKGNRNTIGVEFWSHLGEHAGQGLEKLLEMNLKKNAGSFMIGR